MKTDKCDHVFTDGVCAFCGLPDGFYQSEAEYLADRLTITEPQGGLYTKQEKDMINVEKYTEKELDIEIARRSKALKELIDARDMIDSIKFSKEDTIIFAETDIENDCIDDDCCNSDTGCGTVAPDKEDATYESVRQKLLNEIAYNTSKRMHSLDFASTLEILTRVEATHKIDIKS